MRASEFIIENMDHSKDDQAVPELRAALLAHHDKLQKASDDRVYDIIDRIMTRIAKSHSISGQQLHDMWVKKYKEIPDTWIMHQQLDELQFMGSTCTKDCSGHRAGYEWSKARGGRNANSLYSPSFNKGSAIATKEIQQAKQQPKKPAPQPVAPNPLRPIAGPKV